MNNPLYGYKITNDSHNFMSFLEKIDQEDGTKFLNLFHVYCYSDVYRNNIVNDFFAALCELHQVPAHHNDNSLFKRLMKNIHKSKLSYKEQYEMLVVYLCV